MFSVLISTKNTMKIMTYCITLYGLLAHLIANLHVVNITYLKGMLLIFFTEGCKMAMWCMG